jgi:hypothetical protein
MINRPLIFVSVTRAENSLQHVAGHPFTIKIGVRDGVPLSAIDFLSEKFAWEYLILSFNSS